MTPGFSGSYAAGDVEFLMTPVEIEDTPIALKEALIQSGQKHYSEMLTRETPPSEAYLRLFYDALALNGRLMAEHVSILAERIAELRGGDITLVSLARAGTPVGVLLKHVLKRHFGRDAAHYSVSIVRDKGLDLHALRHILQRHDKESLVFVDGWTGKGVIAGQLAASLQMFKHTDGIDIAPDLFVLADLCGAAAVAASSEDYLIPSCILNATVSGLVSRSLWREDGFHGCVYYNELAAHDLSRFFIETLSAHAAKPPRAGAARPDPAQLRAISLNFLQDIAQRHQLSHYNYLKPGLGEATRVLLRREARLLLVDDPDAAAVRHLLWLANAKSVPVEVRRDMPYRAAALIKEVQSSV